MKNPKLGLVLYSQLSISNRHPTLSFLYNETHRSTTVVLSTQIRVKDNEGGQWDLNTGNGKGKSQKIGAEKKGEKMKNLNSEGQSWATGGGSEQVWVSLSNCCGPYSLDPKGPYDLFCSPLPYSWSLPGLVPSSPVPPLEPSSGPTFPAALCIADWL